VCALQMTRARDFCKLKAPPPREKQSGGFCALRLARGRREKREKSGEREKRVSERERWKFYSLPSERGDGPFLSALPIVLRGCLLASAPAPKLQPHLECEHHARIKAVCQHI
jgi:hypothetical protein